MAQQLETRRTGWIACENGPWYPSLSHGGIVAYRIWTQTDGRRWWRRHEWKRADGSIRLEEWMGCSGGHCGSEPVLDEAETV